MPIAGLKRGKPLPTKQSGGITCQKNEDVMNLLQQFEKDQLDKLAKEIPDFAPGDTLRVNVKIVEGANERVQAFEGVCIARKNAGINSSFTVRKISHGEGVERVFPLYSPRLESVKVVSRGVVRRSKLYYLRERSGKSARIREKIDVMRKEGAKAQQPDTKDAA